MLEIEALEREAEKQKANEGINAPPGPALALGESEDEDDEEEDIEEEEEGEEERERPVRLTNHTCEWLQIITESKLWVFIFISINYHYKLTALNHCGHLCPSLCIIMPLHFSFLPDSSSLLVPSPGVRSAQRELSAQVGHQLQVVCKGFWKEIVLMVCSHGCVNFCFRRD